MTSWLSLEILLFFIPNVRSEIVAASNPSEDASFHLHKRTEVEKMETSRCLKRDLIKRLNPGVKGHSREQADGYLDTNTWFSIP